MPVCGQSSQGYTRRQVLAAVKGRTTDILKERFKYTRLLARLQAAQVVPIDRRRAAFAYNLRRNGCLGQPSNRGAKNFMSGEETFQGDFEQRYVERAFN